MKKLMIALAFAFAVLGGTVAISDAIVTPAVADPSCGNC